MSIMIAAAALAAAQPAPATATPQPMAMAEHSADAMKDCCCKTMKSKMDSGNAMGGKDEQQGHPAH